MIYLDYSATTPLDSRVADLMDTVGRDSFGNPSSIHQLGQSARARIETARRQVAATIGARPSEIIFTSSGSESNNIVLWDVIQREGKHIIISELEHPSVYTTAKVLRKFGVEITEVGVDNHGRVVPADIAKSIKPETALVTVMTANNETGTIQPIREIAELCEEKNIRFHTDAVQALGKIPIDIGNFAPHTASFSAHKLYGPKGVGALYVARRIKLHPLLHGGGQEQRLRAGTENVAGIAGFGLACELAAKDILPESQKLASFRDQTIGHILHQFPNAVIHGDSEHFLPGVISIGCSGIDAQSLLMKLDLDGFAVSTGAACSSGVAKPSRSLIAMGLNDDECKSTLRISFGRFTQQTEMDAFLESFIKHAKLMTKGKKAEAPS
ncbi:MAG: cysteine desulfurase NifS [Candidatus Marinimicrobia bacterium]|nr:cysteine desulfurase NifS [Candidatus Neomarinimicrobiota bacterium]|tara:strand:- start:2949 stop:4097 length:1149 start_codon:yes stop_codon:yes gene_type:complete